MPVYWPRAARRTGIGAIDSKTFVCIVQLDRSAFDRLHAAFAPIYSSMDKHGKFIPRNKRRESNVSQAQPTKVRELEWGRTAMEVAAGVGGGASAGGSGICEHGRQKHQCKECSGSGMYRKSRFDQPPTGLHAHSHPLAALGRWQGQSSGDGGSLECWPEKRPILPAPLLQFRAF
jgi:hypothetical protein